MRQWQLNYCAATKGPWNGIGEIQSTQRRVLLAKTTADKNPPRSKDLPHPITRPMIDPFGLHVVVQRRHFTVCASYCTTS
jgi:hypothetical protein